MLDLSFFTLIITQAEDVVKEYILIWSNLIQLLIAGFLLLLSIILIKKTHSMIKTLIRKIEYINMNKSLTERIEQLILPVAFTLMLWSYVFFATLFSWPDQIIVILNYLFSAWIVVSLMSTFVKNHFLAKTITIFVWIIAALHILKIYDKTIQLIDSWAIILGQWKISLLTVFKGFLLFTALIWLAEKVNNFLKNRVNEVSDLNPSIRVLLIKVINFFVFTIASLIALNSIGIDFTALTVFSGAIGLGLGFGLQKVVSNYISGIIILLDKSVKPGDVIEIGNVYGWITSLNLRFVSVVTREGKEYLIPNESFITERVINWSYTDQLVRVVASIGISYNSDVEKAMQLVIKAAENNPRIQSKPQPICLLTEFGGSSINLELRFWIKDPQNGITNIKSEIYLAIWRLFKDNHVEIPFPQHDLHIKSISHQTTKDEVREEMFS